VQGGRLVVPLDQTHGTSVRRTPGETPWKFADLGSAAA
jgi:hypothetical protein